MQRREFARHHPRDADAYHRYSTDVMRQCKFIRPLLLRSPPDPTSFKPRDIRELLFGNYRVIFRLEAKRVSILTVLQRGEGQSARLVMILHRSPESQVAEAIGKLRDMPEVRAEPVLKFLAANLCPLLDGRNEIALEGGAGCRVLLLHGLLAQDPAARAPRHPTAGCWPVPTG